MSQFSGTAACLTRYFPDILKEMKVLMERFAGFTLSFGVLLMILERFDTESFFSEAWLNCFSKVCYALLGSRAPRALDAFFLGIGYERLKQPFMGREAHLTLTFT